MGKDKRNKRREEALLGNRPAVSKVVPAHKKILEDQKFREELVDGNLHGKLSDFLSVKFPKGNEQKLLDNDHLLNLAWKIFDEQSLTTKEKKEIRKVLLSTA